MTVEKFLSFGNISKVVCLYCVSTTSLINN